MPTPGNYVLKPVPESADRNVLLLMPATRQGAVFTFFEVVEILTVAIFPHGFRDRPLPLEQMALRPERSCRTRSRPFKDVAPSHLHEVSIDVLLCKHIRPIQSSRTL